MEFNNLVKQTQLKVEEPFELTPPPSVKKTNKKLKTGSREYIIKNCQQCKGNPKIEELNVPGFTGKKCGDCMEVIEYARTG